MNRKLLILAAALLLMPSPVNSLHLDPDTLRDPVPERIMYSYPAIDDRYRQAAETTNEVLDSFFNSAMALTEPYTNLLPTIPMTYYADGTPDNYAARTAATDPFRDAMGVWRVIGDDLWKPSPDAASSGNWGHSAGGKDSYPASTRSILVTPELDLRTGADTQGQDDFHPIAFAAGFSFVETTHFLEFQMRTNLASTADRAFFHVLTRPPQSVADFDNCFLRTDCRTITVFPSSTGWFSETISLDAESETGPVWVGFELETGAQSPGYFDEVDDVGFVGFQVDEVRLRGPAALQNIQVHEILSPAQNAVYDAAANLDVFGFVRNTGIQSVDIAVSTILRIPGNPDQVRTEEVTLDAGRTYVVNQRFAGPHPTGQNSQAIVRFAYINDDAQRPSDIRSSDDIATTTFDIQRMRSIDLGTPSPSSKWVSEGEDLRVSVDVTNQGTVADTVTLVPTLVNVIDQKNPVTANERILGLPEDITPTLTLDPGEVVNYSWGIDTEGKGRYNFFVRTQGGDIGSYDEPPFSFSDLSPTANAQYPGTYTSNEINVNGVLDEPIWATTPRFNLEFEGEDGEPTQMGAFRVVNTDTDVYLSFVFENRPLDQPSADEDEVFEIFFDDRADSIILQGEDGVRFDGAQAAGVIRQDLAFQGTDPSNLHWEVQSSLSGDMRRQFTPNGFGSETGTYVIEIRRPIGETNPIRGLTAVPGDDVRFVARIISTEADGNNIVTSTFRFPSNAAIEDGEFATDPDGSMNDESFLWPAFSLRSAVPLTGDRELSPGFGIGTGPPLVYSMELREGCEDFNQWRVQNAFNVNRAGTVVGQDTWNCGTYGPEGRPMMYAGIQPGAECGLVPCPPYSAREFTGNSPPVQTLQLETPLISVDAEDPYLFISHQYANPIRFKDDSPDRTNPANIEVRSIAYVTARIDGTSQDIYLVPDGGYDTEESVGLIDPAMPGARRNFFDYSRPGDLSTTYCDELNQPNAISGEDNQPPINCGWWWPTGELRWHRPVGETYPIGGSYSGSPWKIDRIPLNAFHPINVDGHGTPTGATQLVDLRGQDVRFTFNYVRAQSSDQSIQDPSLDPPHDYGWRIDAVAITDGLQPVRDISVVAASLSLPYDAEEIGIGPGTYATAMMTLENSGQLPLLEVSAQLNCVDLDENPPGTLSPSSLPAPLVNIQDGLQPGERADVEVRCLIPQASNGNKIRMDARAVLPLVDDLSLNDVALIPGIYSVKASPDLEVQGSMSPEIASKEFVRAAQINLINRGNVPISSFEVSTKILEGESSTNGKTYRINGQLPIGESLPLAHPDLDARRKDDPNQGVLISDLFHATGKTGDFSLMVSGRDVEAFGIPDTNTLNDISISGFRAVDRIYANDFDSAPIVELPGLLTGNLRTEGDDIWNVAPGPTSNVLRVGNGEEIAPSMDGSIVLPPMDLTSASRATLSLLHRYDLEANYDAARVELSSDQGKTWVPFAPQALGEEGTGYPDRNLVGSNGLLDGNPESQATTFSGSSFDHPGADGNGWLRSEFDLTTVPVMQEYAQFVDFPLNELAPNPSTNQVIKGSKYFFGPGWDQSGSVDRGWLLENITHNEPKPKSGSQMWWSGTPGHFDDAKVDLVHTTLRFPVSLSAANPFIIQGTNPVEEVVLSFYDWRSGWTDHELLGERDGSGGVFNLILEVSPTERIPLDARAVAREADGWTLREALIPATFLGQEIILEFDYEANRSSYPGATSEYNDGWFLDDIAVDSYLIDGGERSAGHFSRMPLDTLEAHEAKECKDYPISIDEYRIDIEDSESVGCWTLVSRGAERNGAWHIEDVTGPSGESILAWSIASQNEQGYPHLLNSRVITPEVDLRTVVGNEATLRFDHRYEMEADVLNNIILHARDGGVVEVQAYDPLTASYGPWQQLTQGPISRTIIDSRYSNDNMPDGILDPTGFFASGYPAMMLRGQIWPFADGEPPFYIGYGAPTESYDSICRGCARDGGEFTPFPVGYAISGSSLDTAPASNGWLTAGVDVTQFIGQKVRFAFHAFSNPSYPQPAPELLGWEVSNIRVDGTVFQGGPVELRLRAGTDESVLDGVWEIDSLELTAAVFERNVAISSLSEATNYPSNSVIERQVMAQNLGQSARTGLALSVRALRSDTGDPITFDIGGATQVPVEEIAAPRTGEWVGGPFSLNPVGEVGSEALFTISMPNPPAGVPISLEVSLLEDQGDDVDEGGVLVHYPRYTTPDDQAISNTRDAWTIMAVDTTNVQWNPTNSGFPLTMSGGGPSQDPISIQGQLSNTGTTTVQSTIRWSVTPVLDGQGVADFVSPLVVMSPGEALDVSYDLPALSPGIYTVSARLTSLPGVNAAQLDFPVGRSELLNRYNFGQPLWAMNWSPDGVDSDVRFSNDRIPGWLSWGTHPFSGAGYCGAGLDGPDPGISPDNLPCREGGGYLSWVISDPIDLSVSLNDQNIITLNHAYDFIRGDGGRVEAAIGTLDENGIWQMSPCDDPSRGVDWLQLSPVSGNLYDGSTLSIVSNGITRLNPLGVVPVFAGPRGSLDTPIQSTFDLDGLMWCPGGTQAQPFDDALIALAFEVGIQDTPKASRPGWQISDVSISSGTVEIGPEADGIRSVPIIRNAPKSLAFSITNTGIATDTYSLSIAPQGLLTDSQVSLVDTQVTVAGKSSELAWVDIQTLESLPAGQHEFVITVVSDTDARISQFLTTQLDVNPINKADLSVELNPSDAELKFQQGSVVPIHAHVRNTGSIASKATTIQFEVTNPHGETTTIETLTIPPLCPARDCTTGDSVKVISSEWGVPNEIGMYSITATVDPLTHLLDLDADNNQITRDVQVIPLQLPDLVVSKIKVLGGTGQSIDSGDVATVQATVTNDGKVATSGATLYIRAGTTTMTEATIPMLAPGNSVTIEASRVVPVAPSGRIDFRATIIGGNLPELRTDNNEGLVSLSVSTHDVRASTREQIAVAPGGVAAMPVEISNHGNTLERLTLSVDGPQGWIFSVLTPDLLIPPGSSLTGLVFVRAPDDALAGDTTALIKVSANQRLLQSIPSTIQVAATIEAPETTLDLDPMFAFDHEVNLDIQSLSNAAQTIRVRDSLKWLKPTTFDLGASASRTVPLEMRIPLGTAAGEWENQVTIEAIDGSWSIVEPRTITVLPTVEIGSFWADVTPMPAPGTGERMIGLDLEIWSRSNMRMSLDFNVTQSAGTKIIAPAPIFLDVLELQTVPISVLIDERLAEAEGSITVRMTAGDLVNDHVVPLPDMTQLPDLLVASLSAEQAKGDNAVTFTSVIRNQGPVDAPASQIFFYADGTLIQVTTVPPLASGESTSLETSWTPARGAVHQVIAIVDGARSILELHEDNNGASIEVETENPALTSRLFAPSPSWFLVPLAAALLRRRWT